jgi:diacylglycerol kinase (ATP)
LLDVTVVGDATKFEIVRTFPRVFKGTHVSHPKVQTYRGARVTVASLDSEATMDVYADGERVGPLPATMEARAGAITVRVP